MNKIFKYGSFLILALAFLTVSCEKTTEDISTVTYYAIFDMQGEDYMVIEKGVPFVDPGVTAMANGESVDVTVSGTVDENTPGVYYIDYSAVNADNYSASTQRKVRVIELGTNNVDIAGTYDGIRVSKLAGGTVTITKIGDGVFEIDDILGGYYWQYNAYGPSYAANGIFTENADGTWTCSQGYIPGWSDPTVAQDIVVDMEAGTISYYALMIEADFGFDVVLTIQ